ncbi:MAG: tRNA pseudouridine(13) synthase TruD [Phycisphaerales bacterium]|nr:MAG: tRNA pseudouridine(13) synthase TruD [Phycisphaerales bacterium]
MTAMSDTLALLTADVPGTGGKIKMHDTDFVVEEIPLYQAGGNGSHTYAFIEKRGIGTREAIDRIARALDVPGRHVGSAGLKDVHAVTRQWISIEHVGPERLTKLDLPNVKILEVTRHTNKLKPGHLAGNRFVVRLRRLTTRVDEAARTAEQVLSILAQKGLPNYFGPQRFGNRDNNHLLGRTVIRDDAQRFVDLFLGSPQEEIDSPATLQARTLYDEGHYQEALSAWPGQQQEQCRALRALVKSQGDKRRAYYAVDKHLKGFFVSAYQAEVFNRVLAARMPEIDTLLLGDMAYKHVNGASFQVEDPAVEQPRCDRFEISPTGPLFGQRTKRLTGPAGDIENPILEIEELGEGQFRQMKRLGARGGRRPLRVQPKNTHAAPGEDESGPYLELTFELPPGSYATTLVTEITKNRPAD